MLSVHYFAANRCPDVSISGPAVLLSLKSRRELSFASFLVDLGDRRACRPQATTARWVFVQAICASHLNGRIWDRSLEVAGATPFRLSFQCIKVPPAMMSYAIITYNCNIPELRATGPLNGLRGN